MKITLDTFIISDTHFGHKAVLRKEASRITALNSTCFTNFDDFSISCWNETVKQDDSILHLGDLFFGNGNELLSRLSGKKMLILGNNDIGKCESLKDWKIIKSIKFKLKDKKEYKKAMKKKWGSALDNPYATGLIIDINNVRVMFSHFPVGERKRNDKYWAARDIIDYAYHLTESEINIHGHIHSRDSKQKYCFNASTERLLFRPKKLRDILFEWTSSQIY
ncbi:hypothetical protein LS73_002930 [Helicobacter muridarum]|uniref:Predicted phosphoesterase or phosphohydrolase n=1 Tax=Helicobacter muridarum TaxID=216 RepID=A0A099TXL3_9HELI|nr:metallophosphoesterase family protein [Helicobacter muridarum]TLE00871.1 hypothetical protein LS73_002930 [Helicobacter muridarum]STQ86643.1 Predicted phosphoesterase or phosphohydrolase [Helicobacter muridarum]